MNMKEASGLMALVAYGAPDQYLHGNPQATVFHSGYKRVTNSQFTFKCLDLAKGPDNVYQALLPKECDMVGRCYLSIQTEEKAGNPYSTIGSVSVSTKSDSFQQTLETLNGSTLEVLAEANTDWKAESEERHLMVPLPFFFTQRTTKYLPIVALGETDITFECTLSVDAVSIQLVYQAVYLDTDERRRFASEPMETLHTLAQTKTCTIDVKDGDALIDLGCFNSYVKDIRAMIEPDDSTDGECVEQLNIFLNKQAKPHMSLNAMMSRRVLPRQLYKIENSKPIYYMPFCHDPSALVYEQTSQINFSRIDKAQLQLRLKPGRYTVTLVARYFDVLRFNKGRCGFVYKAP